MASPFQQVIGAVAVTTVVGGAVAAGIFLPSGGSPPPPPPPGLANLWIDPTVSGTCTPSGTAVAYNAATACSTPQAAYNAGSSGSVIRIPCGDYSTQASTWGNIAYNASKDGLASNEVITTADDTQCVTFPNPQTAPNSIATWSIQSGHIEFHHIKFPFTTCVSNGPEVPPCPATSVGSTGTGATTGAHDVVLDDIHAGDLVFSGGVFNILVENSNYGPMYDNHSLLHCNGSGACTAMPHDITIQDTSFHDVFNSDACIADNACFGPHHAGCAMTMNSGYNIVLNRTHWYNCEDLPLYIHPANSAEVHDVTVENSEIGGLHSPVLGNFTAAAISQGCAAVGACPPQLQNDFLTGTANAGVWNVRFYNNTFASQLKLLPSSVPNACSGTGGSGGCEYRGNIISPACSGNSGFSTGWTVQYNADLSKFCGSGTLLGSATGTATACGGSAVCNNNYKTSDFGLAPDGYHLTVSSPLNGILPSGLPWMPTTDIDGLSRSVNSSPGADDGVPIQTGQSLAVCSPSPCTTGTLPTFARAVSVGTINYGGGFGSDVRHYGTYVPANLVTTDPTHKFAVLFFFGGGGGTTEQQVFSGASQDQLAAFGAYTLANNNKFVVVLLAPPPVGGTHSGWAHPAIDCAGAGGVVGGGTCNAAGLSETPYVQAVIASFEAAFPNADTARFYATGGSSGANATRNLICDSTTASEFRGVATFGGGPAVKYGTLGPLSCPAGLKTRFYLEITGSTSQQDPATTLNVPTNCTSACDHTNLGLNDGRAAWATYLGGCGSAVHTTTGNQVPPTDVYDYQCSNVPQSSQFEAVEVNGGGHTWCNLDTAPIQPTCTTQGSASSNPTGGWVSSTWMWNWFATRQWSGP